MHVFCKFAQFFIEMITATAAEIYFQGLIKKDKIMTHNLLKGKRGIIFGALNDMSIAWKVAEKAVEEGAIITLSNTPVAVRMGDTAKLGE